MRALLFLLLLMASSALADPLGDAKADLRALVSAGDIDAVDAMMDSAYRASLASHIYDLPRVPNTAFSVTDPKTKDFIAAWRTAKPDSPHALTAQAWMLWRAGWLVRGGESAHWTYPAAFAMQADLHRQARDLAWQAFDLAPDLVPASDAVLRMAQVTHGQDYVSTIIADIMALTPNRGTLLRGFDALDPKWGGSLTEVAALCGLYAAKVVEVADYTDETCLIEAFLAVGDGMAETWALSALDRNSNPILEYARVRDAIYWRRGTDAANKVLARYLAKPGNYDWNAAGIHDLDYRVPHGLPPLAPEFFQRRLDHAVAEVVFDPYDAELLQIVFEASSYESYPLKHVDPQLQLETSRRVLTVEPFSAKAWVSYASNATFVFHYKEDQADPFWINAMVYSNHNPFYIVNFAKSKLTNLLLLLYDDMSNDVQVRDLPESTEQVTSMVCPLIRVTRVLDQVCTTSAKGHPSCSLADSTLRKFSQIKALAKAEHVCTAELTTPIDDLIYQPQVIDWSAVPRFVRDTTP